MAERRDQQLLAADDLGALLVERELLGPRLLHLVANLARALERRAARLGGRRARAAADGVGERGGELGRDVDRQVQHVVERARGFIGLDGAPPPTDGGSVISRPPPSVSALALLGVPWRLRAGGGGGVAASAMPAPRSS